MQDCNLEVDVGGTEQLGYSAKMASRPETLRARGAGREVSGDRRIFGPRKAKRVASCFLTGRPGQEAVFLVPAARFFQQPLRPNFQFTNERRVQHEEVSIARATCPGIRRDNSSHG